MEKQNLTTGFQNVDNSQYQFLIKFLEDVAYYPSVLESLEFQLKWLDIKEGNRVLDVGCGIGVQAQAMAKLVGAEGKVTGTDLSTVMVEIAKEKAASSNLPLDFLAADAVAQPFPDQSFDRIRTERVLMYVKDLQTALREFKRLLKPGGKLVIFDFDWDTITIAHRDKALTRKIVRYASDSFPNGRVGAELFAQMRKAGFEDVKVRPFSYAGSDIISHDIAKRIYEGILQTGVSNSVFTQTEITNWWNEFDEEAKAGNLFVSYQGFIVGGTGD
ncbi:MAG TPA: methyltransferase domain-containing protein [Mucilaginibacter sp.]|jgi:ubiquinone/menaquinone biosynthesis C-methylase UbiE